MNREKGSPLGLYTLGVAALFLAGFFLLVVFGARIYRATAAGQNENMRSRALLAYLAATIHGYDARGAVTVEDAENGQILRIADGDTGYGLRIYCSGGQLLEDYAALDSALSAENAQIIGATERFEVEPGSDGLWRITTDAGQVLLRLRSEEGGAA